MSEGEFTVFGLTVTVIIGLVVAGTIIVLIGL
jgi:hypothetical protein